MNVTTLTTTVAALVPDAVIDRDDIALMVDGFTDTEIAAMVAHNANLVG